MHKIGQEKICCIIMGDFNLNLLDSDSHILGSNFFNPRIFAAY